MHFRLRDAVYGAAVGDALGVPYEFMGRDSFECAGMASGGSHGQPAGTFSDDTSMMLATCDSIRELGRIDCADIRKRFEDWYYRGKYAVGGKVFDCGNTVATAIGQKRGCEGERSNGNGSLMRIAPLAFTDVTDEEVWAVSAITHAHETSCSACVSFVKFLSRTIVEYPKWAYMEAFDCSEESFYALLDKPREDIRSGGYVLDTLEAAIWCFIHTDTYEECVLEAVNLGGDTDTTACIAGAIAGTAYGYDAIPAAWLGELSGMEIIDSCLF